MATHQYELTAGSSNAVLKLLEPPTGCMTVRRKADVEPGCRCKRGTFSDKLGERQADTSHNGSHTKHLISGAVSAVVSRTALAPFERIKLEMLLHNRQGGFLAVARWVLQEDGLLGFWKGNRLNLLRTTPYKVRGERCLPRLLPGGEQCLPRHASYTMSATPLTWGRTMSATPHLLPATPLTWARAMSATPLTSCWGNWRRRSPSTCGLYGCGFLSLRRLVRLQALNFASFELYRKALQSSPFVTELGNGHRFLAGALAGAQPSLSV
jgi:Mitochondrial carrier protein